MQTGNGDDLKAEVRQRSAAVSEARVLEHRDVEGDYRLLVMDVPAVASLVAPGQFVHLRVPHLDDAVLRRPFSIYRADATTLSILYKCVGHGTRALRRVRPGEDVNIVGPLGNVFPDCPPDRVPILVAGGYGVAPLSLLASRLPRTGVVCVGGATARDILCTEDFERLDWDVRITTEDGSRGEKGLVTAVLDNWFAHNSAQLPELYACGPDGLLRAVGARAIQHTCNGWLSLDKHMGCGVGACLACVQKIRWTDGTVAWSRVCREGPIYESRTIAWDTTS